MTDDRICCTQCLELAGRHCLAARERRRIDVHQHYAPVTEFPLRCCFYRPLPSEPDQRSGEVRFPLLHAEYQTMLAATHPP